MKIHLIVAMTADRVIGDPGKLPWHIPEDLKRFKEITTGHTVIMGLNTYRTINRPLPNRNNIVLSHEEIDLPGCVVATSVEEALNKAKKYGKGIFIMGGASVYEQMLPLAEVLHISHVKKNYPGSIKFPEYDQTNWREIDSEEYAEFTAKTYERITKLAELPQLNVR